MALPLFCLNMSSFLHFDYFLLIETWLNSNISDTELGMFDYNIYRLDRNSNNSSHLKGGGVLIAIHKRYRSTLIPSSNLKCEFNG